MKKDGYVYSTKEISQYYDLTSKGLAYYEEQNLISPIRTGTAGYRTFTLDDCYSLYHSKLYTNAGFPLKKTAELLGSDREDEILSSLRRQIQEEEDNMKKRKILLEHLSFIEKTVEDYRKNGQTFTYGMSPEFCRLFVRTFDEEHFSTIQQSREFAQWNQVTPADTASLKYRMDRILSDKEDMDVGIGNIMLKEVFDLFGFTISDRVEQIPSRMCIQTVLCGNSEDIDKRNWLMSTLDYMEKNGYRLCGDVVTSLLLVTGKKNSRKRYELAWFPAERISD